MTINNQLNTTFRLGLADTFSKLLHLQLQTQTSNSHLFNFQHKASTPSTSPKEDISQQWRQIHGLSDWTDLLDPLLPSLRREILKYGDFAQATYDGFDFDSSSDFRGSCRYNKHKLFNKLSLSDHGYKITKYLYAMSEIDVPRWLERSHLVEAWSKDSNWMGYVAVSNDDETKRIGRRDIVVAWRGTVAATEWYEDVQYKLKPIGENEAKVEHGFFSIYNSKSEFTRYNKSSASEQVMEEIKNLVKLYREEELSLTIIGHSLGGASAFLNAYEAATTIENVHVSVISFGAPRVGNSSFKEELEQKGVKILRVVTKKDLVLKLPGGFYTHVGAKLKLDVRSSPYLKHGFNLVGFHSLETYLHLVDGYSGAAEGFRVAARRDVALVNKGCDMLVDEVGIPECWYQLENKGLVRNEHGRWIKPAREFEDIPSPVREVYGMEDCVRIEDTNL